MERKNTHDPLEGYFRRTLDDHEAAPPADLWERVEAELPPPTAPPRPWWAAHRLTFIAGALAMLLLLTLLDATHRPPRQRGAAFADAAQTPAPLAASVEEPAAPPLTGATALSLVQTLSGAYETRSDRSAASLPKVKPTPALHDHGLDAARLPTPPLSETDTSAEYTQSQIEALTTRPTRSEGSVGTDLSEQAAPTGIIAAGGAPVLTALTALPLAAVVSFRPTLSAPPALAPVRPARPLSGWSAGLYVSCMRVPSAPAPRPGPAQRMLFISVPQPERPAWEGGLRVRRRIGRRWGLEAGLLYSEHTHNLSYISRFRFGDGRPLSGGATQPTRREYAHYLNTPGGSATVDFRMEPTNASDPISQGEVIHVRAIFTEYTSQLRLPVLASYSIGSARLLGVARAGIVADVFLKNELQLSSFTSENARVRLATGMRPTIQWTPARNLSFGYWLSAGAAYRLSRHIALSIEPVLIGRFSHRDAKGQPLPAPASFGGQVGMWYAW